MLRQMLQQSDPKLKNLVKVFLNDGFLNDLWAS